MDVEFKEADDYIDNSKTYYYQNLKMKHEKFFKQLELERELSTLRNKRETIDNEIALLEKELKQLESSPIPKPQRASIKEVKKPQKPNIKEVI